MISSIPVPCCKCLKADGLLHTMFNSASVVLAFLPGFDRFFQFACLQMINSLTEQPTRPCGLPSNAPCQCQQQTSMLQGLLKRAKRLFCGNMNWMQHVCRLVLSRAQPALQILRASVSTWFRHTSMELQRINWSKRVGVHPVAPSSPLNGQHGLHYTALRADTSTHS